MSIRRRTFLAGLATATAGSATGITPMTATAAKPSSTSIVNDVFPAFSLEEYSQRLARVKHEMIKQGIDLLYVTDPSHMCYLHGYTCTWYRANSSSNWPAMAGTAIHVNHDKMIHFDFSDEIEQLKLTSIVSDTRIFTGDQSVEDSLAFLLGELEAEGWIKGSRVGLELWSYLPPRAVSEAIEAGFLKSGAKEAKDGSFVCRRVRRIKSAKEIEYIKQAVKIGEIGLQAAADIAKPGVMECEVYAEAMRAMYVAGGEIQGINQGVKFRGLNHTYSGRNKIKSGDVAGFDICGVVHRYHGNVERAFYFREPSKKAQEAFKLSGEAYGIVQAVARPGTKVSDLSAVLEKHFSPKGAWDRAYYIGGYELGIAFPPDWVGEWEFDATNSEHTGVFEEGMVTNFESIFYWFESNSWDIYYFF